MTPERARKSARLEVFASGGDVYSVPGDSAVHEINIDRDTGELRCNCLAAGFGNQCTHIDAVIEHVKGRAA